MAKGMFIGVEGLLGLQQGTDPKHVHERMGYSDESLSLNIVSHVPPGLQPRAEEKMVKILGPTEISETFCRENKKMPFRDFFCEMGPAGVGPATKRL